MPNPASPIGTKDEQLDWLNRHQRLDSVANFWERAACVVVSNTDAQLETLKELLRERESDPTFPGGAALLATREILKRRLAIVEAAIERLGLYIIEDEEDAPRWMPRVIDGGQA